MTHVTYPRCHKERVAGILCSFIALVNAVNGLNAVVQQPTATPSPSSSDHENSSCVEGRRHELCT